MAITIAYASVKHKIVAYESKECKDGEPCNETDPSKKTIIPSIITPVFESILKRIDKHGEYVTIQPAAMQAPLEPISRVKEE